MKILAVDDDVKVREMLHEMLSRLGYECRTATNGREALGMLAEDNFSIVISDIKMPGMDGMELLKGIKGKYPDLDMIIITGNSEEYTFTDVIKAGASDFIPKPFSHDELEAKLKRIAKERKLRVQLIESRNKLMAIFDGIRDGMYSIDQDFKILSANKAFAESVGLSVRDVIGRHCYELTHKQNVPCEGNDHNCPGKRCFARGLVTSAIHKHYGKEGKECYVEVTAMPLVVDGNTTQAIIISRDITERFLAEKKLEEAEKKYRTLFEMVNDGIISTNEEGVIISFNKKAEDIFGYSQKEILGKQVFILSPERYREAQKVGYQRVREIGKTKFDGITIEYEGLRKDGTEIPLELSYSALQDEHGGLIISTVIRDISERVHLEKEKRRKSVIERGINQILSETLLDKSLESVYQLCLNTSMELTGSDLGFIGELNSQGCFDTIVISDTGWKACQMSHEQSMKFIKNMELKSFWGSVLKENKPSLVNDPASHPDRVGAPKGHPKIRCFLGVPLSRGRKAFGMIGLANKSDGYVEEDIEALTQITSIFTQVIEHQRTEENLKELYTRNETILKTSMDGFFVLKNDGSILEVNNSFAKMVGYSPEELLSMNITGLELKELPAGNNLKSIMYRDYHIFETQYLHKNDHIVDLEISTNSLDFKERKFLVCFAHNISERKKMENSIKKRIEVLSALNDVAKEVGSSLELDLILKHAFQKILDITGLNCGAILLLNGKGDKLVIKGSTGMESENLKDGAEIALDADVAGKVIQSKEPMVVEDTEKYDMPTAEMLREEKINNFISIPIISRNKIHGCINLGSRKQHRYSPEEISLLILIGKQIGLAIDNARLFEETRNALEELKKTQSYLLQSEKMASIGQLAAGVAHEINNPTGFVHSNLGSLNKYSNKVLELLMKYEEGLAQLKDNGSKEVASFYEEIEELKNKLKIDFIMKDFQKVISDSLEGTERIKKIVADLKSFSRVDQADFKHSDINEGLQSTLNVVWNELKYKCTVEKNYGDLPQIYCNLAQLNQVFMNLLVNAAQSIENKGKITISTRYINEGESSAGGDRESNYIEIKISDTGSGIPEDKLNRIFEPFFTTKEVGKGTGLGLCIAYDIIQKHKGEIKVDSEVGKGTTFIIQLPKLEGEQRTS